MDQKELAMDQDAPMSWEEWIDEFGEFTADEVAYDEYVKDWSASEEQAAA